MHAINRGREASSDLSGTSPPFPASNRGQRDPCLLVVPSAIGKLRRGELGRGRNRAPNYKVTRENQSLLELSWYLTQGSPDSGSMALSGEEKEEGGVQSRILHQRKCATLCPNYPQSCGGSCYLFRCFSLNVHLPVLAVCPCHTYQGSSFGTSITDYNDTELFSKLCSVEVYNITQRTSQADVKKRSNKTK